MTEREAGGRKFKPPTDDQLRRLAQQKRTRAGGAGPVKPTADIKIPPAEIMAAAGAIANARAGRRGAPAITNVLDLLPRELLAELMEDAKAALLAAREAQSR